MKRQSATRSRYSFKVKRPKTTKRYRVRVIAKDGGEHVPGTSRSREGQACGSAALTRGASGRPKW